ncbi:MAG: hypothetical protein EXQ74_07565 [Thermoleophilia bacterium]|nr:hypothetical protein [Thermoleophilia bacterium]
MNILRMGGLAVAVFVSATLLAGCGSSTPPAASSATSVATSEMVTAGIAQCDYASINQVVQESSDSDSATVTLRPDAFGCADGWAYAFPDTHDYTYTVVFEAEGQFWIPKDRQTVCITPGNEVPESIFRNACETN